LAIERFNGRITPTNRDLTSTSIGFTRVVIVGGTRVGNLG